MEHATPDDKPKASKPINWYSGWRLLATAAATVLGAKLIGILGTAVALLLFFWLQPKRGTGLALAAAAATGVLAAVVSSFVVLPSPEGPRTTPTTDRFGGVLVEPAR